MRLCTSHLSGVEDSTFGSSPSGPKGARFREKCFPPVNVSIINFGGGDVTTALWFALVFPSCHGLKLDAEIRLVFGRL